MRVALVAICLAFSSILASCTGDGSPEAVRQTPAVPASPLTSAAKAMQALNSYTFEGDVAADAFKFHIVGTFNAPNRLSETITSEGAGATKIVVIGDRSYQQNPGSSQWIAGPGSPGGPAADPRAAFGAVAQAEVLSAAADRYAFRVTGQVASSLILGSAEVRGTATLEGGRIVTLSYANENPAVSVGLSYAAFNSAPLVTPPPA
jgi:hypothetical protein